MLNSGIGIGIVLSARDLASGPLGKVERSFASLDQRIGAGQGRVSSALDSVGDRVGNFARGVLGSLGAAAVTKMAGDFEEQLAALGGIANATGDKLHRLEVAALDAGLATQFSPTDAIGVLQELASASYSADQSIRMLIPALDLAAGSFGKLSPSEAVGTARQALSAFSLAADDAALTMDQLLQSVNLLPLAPEDLPLALSIAPRGAQALQQSLDETLISLGFARAIITRTERASTAVAVAMERMASPEVQERLGGLGVAVADDEGRFRSFLDVILDLMPVLDRMTEQKRAGFLIETFGTEGLAGVQAMMRGIEKGIETSSGSMVRGAEAVRYLRGELANAAGTGARFRNLMLDTFAGQKKMLLGSLQTLAIVAGRSFTAVLKPVLSALVDGINALIRAIDRVPAPLRKAVAGVVVAVAGFVALGAASRALRGSLGFAAVGLRAFGAAAAAASSALAPVLVVAAAAAAVVAAFVIAYRKNLGGFADWMNAVGRRIKLAWQGLVQVFSDGAFSGAVLAELSKVENSGVKRFVVAIYMLGYRLQRLGQGIREGFVAALERARPIFDELRAAFTDLGSELGGLVGELTGSANGLPSSEWVSFGQVVGKVVGTLVSWLAMVVGWVTRLTAGFVAGFRAVDEYLSPVLATLGYFLAELVDTFKELFGITSDTTEAASETGSVFRTVGEVVGGVFGIALQGAIIVLTAAVKTVQLVIAALNWLKDAFLWVVDTIDSATETLIDFFVDDLPSSIGTSLGQIGGFFQSLHAFVVTIIDAIRKAIDELIGWIKDAYETISDVLGSIKDGISDASTSVSDFVSGRDTSLVQSIRQVQVAPSTAAAATTDTHEAALARFQEQLAATTAAATRRQPIHVAVQVDGETLARATAQGHQDAARRAFVPLPSY